MKQNVKGLDITRLVLSILAIIWAVALGLLVFNYIRVLTEADDMGILFLILLFPIFLAFIVMLVINAIMGIIGVGKYFKNRNVELVNRNVGMGRIVGKMIVAILGLSPPLIISYICDITEVEKKKKLEKV